MVAAWASLHCLLSRDFARLEVIETRQALRRAAAALEERAETLRATARDWATRDDTYAFMQDRNQPYVDNHLTHDALTAIQVDLVLFVDRAGRIVHGLTAGEAEVRPILPSAELARRLSPKGPLLSACLRGQSASGMILLPKQMLLVAAQPILTSLGEGPARGMLVMGRIMSQGSFTRISDRAMVPFAVRRLDDPGLPSDFQEAAAALGRSDRTLIRASGSQVASGYELIADIRGIPALIVRADEDRYISRQAQAILLSSLLTLLCFGAVLGLAVNLVLEKMVISRLSSLRAEVKRVAESGEPSARVSVSGRDELSGLADSINGMLSALEQSGNTLQENESQLRMVLDSVHAGFLIIEAETHSIVEANPAALHMLGCAREDLIGSTCHQRVCPAEVGRCPITDLDEELDNSERTALTIGGESVPVLKTAALVTLGGKQYILESFVDITERKQAEAAVRYQSNHDGLTALPNRQRFSEQLGESLAEARRSEKTVAVLLLDLDRFKTINDTLGHAVGDELLKQASERLSESLRGNDSVARLGGDEFAVVLTAMESPEGAAVAARRVLSVLQAPFNIGGHELHTSASIGISLFPRDGAEAEALLQNADIALYHAKDQGRNTFRYYDSWISASTRESLALENDLRHALERDELVVYYQPQIHVPTGRIIGMEALLRWRHPVLGLVLPGRFISIAEETGLIEPIGEWVLRHTCAQNKAWQRENLPPVKMAVNLSPLQFHQQNLVAVVRQALGESGLDPRYLQLELTESAAMRNVDFSAKMMARLKGMGVGLCMDDFGVGYTSLVYLKQFPLDTIKIDRTFLRALETDASNATIISAVIAIARSLGLGIIGEGVETPTQVRLLLERDCEVMQGYFFSEPLPAEAAGELLREQQTKRTAIQVA